MYSLYRIMFQITQDAMPINPSIIVHLLDERVVPVRQASVTCFCALLAPGGTSGKHGLRPGQEVASQTACISLGQTLHTNTSLAQESLLCPFRLTPDQPQRCRCFLRRCRSAFT